MLVVQSRKQIIINNIEGKYFDTADYNKFTSDILDAKIKQKELVNKSDIADFVKKKDFDRKLIDIKKNMKKLTKN